MTEKSYLDVLVYGEVTVRIRGNYVLDKREYREWYERTYPWRGDPFDDLDFDEVVEFLKDSPDTEAEVWNRMPIPEDNDKQDLMDFELVEAEYG